MAAAAVALGKVALACGVTSVKDDEVCRTSHPELIVDPSPRPSASPGPTVSRT
ncbi:MAG: hypothetical protein O9345_21005 [Burkholderiaceae bacterium]|jgi:hypothetical protein|nr:hypothetical protein [Burkholderiales bacterium]MCZ8340599.1 hypothetical protein [Burkholderiaceae bacterium]